MKNQATLVTYISHKNELDKLISLKTHSAVEIMVGVKELTRYCQTSIDEMQDLVVIAKKNNFNVVLEWDALNQEEKFVNSCLIIDRLPMHEFKSIRVQDPGAVEYIKNKYPWLKIQLILENGNHFLAK